MEVLREDGLHPLDMNDGLNGEAHDLVVSDNWLYVVGEFSSAGGKPSNFIARWRQTPVEVSTLETVPASVEIDLDAPFPNPFSEASIVSFRIPRTQEVRIEVQNLLGQRVSILQEGVLPAGEHKALWTPGSMSAGVYLIVLQSENQRVVRKVVYVK